MVGLNLEVGFVECELKVRVQGLGLPALVDSCSKALGLGLEAKFIRVGLIFVAKVLPTAETLKHQIVPAKAM